MTGLMSRSYQYHAYTTMHQEVMEIKQTVKDHSETNKTLQDVWAKSKYDGTCCLVYVRLLHYTENCVWINSTYASFAPQQTSNDFLPHASSKQNLRFSYQ
jgi:hypothetical protein